MSKYQSRIIRREDGTITFMPRRVMQDARASGGWHERRENWGTTISYVIVPCSWPWNENQSFVRRLGYKEGRKEYLGL